MTLNPYRYMFLLILILSQSIESPVALYGDKLIPSVHAQDMDPIEEIKGYIKEGQAIVDTAQGRAYSSRRNIKQRVEKYFEALKSFSSALRRLNEYQIEDDALYEQLDGLINKVISIVEVSKEIERLDSELMKSMKNDDTATAKQTAETLIDLDERREGIKYLLSALSESGQAQ